MNKDIFKSEFFLNNCVACILIFILGVRFSIAYFSYFCIIFALYMAFYLYHSKCNLKNRDFFSSFRDHMNLCILTVGFLIFYSLLFVANTLSLHSLDVKIISSGVIYLIPLYAFYFLSQKGTIDKGILIGLSSVILVNGVYSYLQFNGLTVIPLRDVHRIQGFFKHANSFGMILTWCIPFLAYYFFKFKNYKYKFLSAGMIFIGGICLYFSGSRGAEASLCIGLVGSLLLYIWFNRKNLNKKIVGGLIAFCLLTVAGTGIGIHYSMQHERGLGERIFMWQGSIYMWNDHKLSGVGTGKWAENYYSEIYHPKGAHEGNMIFPHSMPLYYLSESGTLGGVGYAALALAMFIVAVKSLKKEQEMTLAVPLMAVYLAFMSEGMVDATISNKMVSLPYFALAGYSIGSLNLKNKKENLK